MRIALMVALVIGLALVGGASAISFAGGVANGGAFGGVIDLTDAGVVANTYNGFFDAQSQTLTGANSFQVGFFGDVEAASAGTSAWADGIFFASTNGVSFTQTAPLFSNSFAAASSVAV
jgi:hypothetical protein